VDQGQITDQGEVSPTRLRVIVGARLRRLREAAGISTDDAAAAIRGSNSKISRIERGKAPFKPRDLGDLLRLYGVSDDELLALAELANRQNWWADYTDILPAHFTTYLGFEQSASLLRGYDAQVVPGLLQTADYARALIEATGVPFTKENTDRLIELRMRRQRALRRDDPPRLWVILDEAVLRRPVGGAETMRGQFRHLIDAAALPNVTIQVLRFGACAPVATGSFVTLRFRENELSDMVFVNHMIGGCSTDKPAEVSRYWDTLNRMSLLAEQPDPSLAILEDGLR
jgi:transcriptional regulator with XRE-family HTH domain